MTAFLQISDAEFEVMKVVWKYAPVNTNEVTEYLVRTTDWSPKTIQTLLKRLVTKKALSYEKQGRIFVYSPLITESGYLSQKSNSFLNKYYDGHISNMVSSFLSDNQLSENDIAELRSILDNHFNNGGK